VKLFSRLVIPIYVFTVPQRHGQTDIQTDDLPLQQYRALRSISR